MRYSPGAPYLTSLRFALRKGCNAKLGSSIRNQRDRFFRLIARDGALRQRIGNAIFRAPPVEPARLHGKADRRMLASERSFANLRFLNGDAIDRRSRIDIKCVVPRRGWKNLPIGGHSPVAQLHPALS